MKKLFARTSKLPVALLPVTALMFVLVFSSFAAPTITRADESTDPSTPIVTDDSAPAFVPPTPLIASLTLNDTVVGGGPATPADWMLTATGASTTPTNLSGVSPVTNATIQADIYTLSEVGDASTTDYTAGTWSCTGATVSGNTLTLTEGQTATCTIANTYVAPSAPSSPATSTPPTATSTPTAITIVGSTIICDSEADMPRWGLGGHTISTTTAADYVAAHPNCHLQADWNFEWANQDGNDPGGAFIGPAGGSYTEFGPTDSTGSATTTVTLGADTQIDLREVLQSGYIPFAYDQSNPDNSATTSAEFYCANDTLNYDNWDFIRTPVAGNTYYCVGFNVSTATSTPVTPVTPPVTPPANNFPNNGGGGSTGGSGGGQVLGASTTNGGSGGLQPEVLGASCGPILSSYLRLGRNNPTDQVEILQNFLNGELGINLPVTGFFGPLTEKAVDAFQVKYGSSVLAPWVPFGLASSSDPTGYVYKTTKWEVNMISCPELDLPAPKLP